MKRIALIAVAALIALAVAASPASAILSVAEVLGGRQAEQGGNEEEAAGRSRCPGEPVLRHHRA